MRKLISILFILISFEGFSQHHMMHVLAGQSVAPTLDSTTFTSSGTFTVPSGVTQVLVRAIGGGASGDYKSSSNGSGYGGGGGAYSEAIINVTSGANYTVTVGAGGTSTTTTANGGGDSWFGSTTTVLAKGGTKALSVGGVIGYGGVISDYTQISFVGGDGAKGSSTTFSGGGGGGAGTTGTGGNAANNYTAGTASGLGTSLYGGNGGAGRTTSGTGNAGSVRGGAGSGGLRTTSTNRAGGAGAAGLVEVKWSTANDLIPTPSATPSRLGGNNNWVQTNNATVSIPKYNTGIQSGDIVIVHLAIVEPSSDTIKIRSISDSDGNQWKLLQKTAYNNNVHFWYMTVLDGTESQSYAFFNLNMDAYSYYIAAYDVFRDCRSIYFPIINQNNSSIIFTTASNLPSKATSFDKTLCLAYGIFHDNQSVTITGTGWSQVYDVVNSLIGPPYSRQTLHSVAIESAGSSSNQIDYSFSSNAFFALKYFQLVGE